MNKDLIEKYDFNFKKKFGQNFLNDRNILEKIIRKSEVDKNTFVIEIGVGAAALTEYLCKNAGFVLGYEIDTTLNNIIEDRLSNYDNYNIIFDDFLKRNILEDLKNYKYEKIYVIANLPYYITTPIITKLIDEKIPVEKIVVMVQKEVGERFSAKIGSKEYNSLTIFLNYYFEITKIIDVSRNSFTPKPNVDSVIVEMKRKKINKLVKNEEKFFKLVRDSFKFKRKNLKNNLVNYPQDKILKVLKSYNLDLTVRAENLSLNQFIEISNEIED